jgi:NADH-quinone oxidoreductase subunit F
MDQLLHKIYHGHGTAEDLRVLKAVAGQIGGRTLCALGDFAINPVLSTVRHFAHEYEAKIKLASEAGVVRQTAVAVAAD